MASLRTLPGHAATLQHAHDSCFGAWLKVIWRTHPPPAPPLLQVSPSFYLSSSNMCPAADLFRHACRQYGLYSYNYQTLRRSRS